MQLINYHVSMAISDPLQFVITLHNYLKKRCLFSVTLYRKIAEMFRRNEHNSGQLFPVL